MEWAIQHLISVRMLILVYEYKTQLKYISIVIGKKPNVDKTKQVLFERDLCAMKHFLNFAMQFKQGSVVERSLITCTHVNSVIGMNIVIPL